MRLIQKKALLLQLLLTICAFSLLSMFTVAAELPATMNVNGTDLNVSCGNDRCEVGENSYNCPSDCARFPYDFSTDFIEPSIMAGRSKSFSFNFKNLLNETIKIRPEFSEQFAKYVQKNLSTLKIAPSGNESLNVTVQVPEGESPGKKTGQLIVWYEEQNKYIPLNLNVLEYSNTLVQINFKTLRQNLKPSEELVVFTEVYSYKAEPHNLTLDYGIFDMESGKEIYSFQRKVEGLLSSRTFVDRIALNNSQKFSEPVSEGQYLIEVNTTWGAKEVSSSSDFFVAVPFWTPQRVRVMSVLGSLILFAVIGVYGYMRYQQWRLDRMRYIPPDLKKIPKKGESMFHVGKIPEVNKQAYLNPRDLTTHCLCAGSTGSGKSVTASIIAEAALLNNIPVIAFDPTNQWTGFVKQLKDKNVLAYYKQFGLSESDARSFKGLIYNVTSPEVNIDIQRYMNPGEITVFNLSDLKPGEYDQAVQRIVNKIFEVSWPESHDLKVFVVFDECHRLLEKYGGQGGYVALEKACREFRKWGIGLLMISQVSADFKQAVAGNILTEVQMNTKNVEDIQKMAQKYGTRYSTKVTRQGVGVAMVQNPKYNDGKPWFVHFRPPLHDPHKISDEELQMYSQYSNKLDELEQYLEKLQQKGFDVNNMMMELKLTRNKLKEGHFKMVDIYIRSLHDNILKITGSQRGNA